MYAKGLGVDKNLDQALKYVELAGEDHLAYEDAKEAIEKEIVARK